MTFTTLTRHPRIATKLNLVAVLAGLALCTLSFASLIFAQRISDRAGHVRTEVITAVVMAAELGVLVERHRRIIEAAPVTFDKAASQRDRQQAQQITDRVHHILGSRNDHFVDKIAEQLPVWIEQGNKVLFLSENFAQDAALKAVEAYIKTAHAIQERIVTYREVNLRMADRDTGELIDAVRSLVNWILLAGLFAAALVGPLTIAAVRRIAERLRLITQAMLALARNQTDVGIPLQASTDEIGEMARALDVFRANALALRAKHEEIAALNSRLDIALNNMARGLSMFDSKSRLIVCNRICRDMYGLPDTLAASGTKFASIVEHWARAHSGSQDEGVLQDALSKWLEAHARKVAGGEEFSELHHIDDGRIIAIVTKPLGCGGWVDVHEDITEKHRNTQKIADLAQRDALTGLANRHSFLEELERTFANDAEGRNFAILWIDLDRFKEVNDTCGHPTGDALLQIVGTRIKAAVRAQDFVARLGGDEFAVMIRGAAMDEARLSRIAQRICDALTQPFAVLGNTVKVGASIGICSAPYDATTPDGIMKTADIALYRAKSAGRGRAIFYDRKMSDELQKRRRLQSDLEEALEQKTLELYYQPILSLDTRSVVSFEALMRWKHAEFGFISPAEFIPLAEETGLIGRLGAWALEEACSTASNWPEHVGVSVNLSPAQFGIGDLLDTTRRALAAARIVPHRLQLEVTETLLLEDKPQTWAILAELKSSGISIALDDFGTGHSSLSYLRSFPFDKIKIDQSFVRDEGRKADGIKIVRAITDLARTLGMTSVAEGVETLEHLKQIEGAQCDEAQGYFFSRPVPVEQVAEALRVCSRKLAA